MPRIKEKVINVFQSKIGEVFDREEIIDLVVNEYPETNRGSVIPSDYCYNMVNAGINFDFHLFESLGEGRYKCLGLNQPYTGPIYWKGQKVGEWKDGRFRLSRNAPPNLIDV
ncbi:MAG: hypothetical protein M1438_16730 [Deltaproteobacteria bacterium]|nr:hypothetical protein [Deltaproteobacteria bacterium]